MKDWQVKQWCAQVALMVGKGFLPASLCDSMLKVICKQYGKTLEEVKKIYLSTLFEIDYDKSSISLEVVWKEDNE